MAKKTNAFFAELLKEGEETEHINDHPERTEKRARSTGAMSRKTVKVSDIVPNPLNNFDMAEDEDFKDLLEGVKAAGTTNEEILCQPADEDGKYTIISGERRWTALTKAGIETTAIKVLPNRLTGADEIVAIMTHNMGRRSNKPYDIPLGLVNLYDALEKTGITDSAQKKETAKEKLKITSERTFSNYNKLATLPVDILKAGQKELLTRDDGLYLADALSKEETIKAGETALDDIREVIKKDAAHEKQVQEIKEILSRLKIGLTKKEKRETKKNPSAFSVVKKISKLTKVENYELPSRKKEQEAMKELLNNSIEAMQKMREDLSRKMQS